MARRLTTNQEIAGSIPASVTEQRSSIEEQQSFCFCRLGYAYFHFLSLFEIFPWGPLSISFRSMCDLICMKDTKKSHRFSYSLTL